MKLQDIASLIECECDKECFVSAPDTASLQYLRLTFNHKRTLIKIPLTESDTFV